MQATRTVLYKKLRCSSSLDSRMCHKKNNTD